MKKLIINLQDAFAQLSFANVMSVICRSVAVCFFLTERCVLLVA